MPFPATRLAAVVLTGGTGERLGGADKASIRLDGSTLLEHALAATAEADEVVVVGEPTATGRAVTWTREQPPGGGPAAGLLAGVDALGRVPDLVCVLAVDMPRFTSRTLDRLVDVLLEDPAADAACLVDEHGKEQWLAGVYRHQSLARVRPADRAGERGLSTRRMLRPLRIVGVPAVADEARDVDTWDDLRDLQGTDPPTLG